MGRSLMRGFKKRQAKLQAERETDEMVAQAWAKFCLKADIIILYTLRVVFKFGKVRLERFYWKMIELQMHMIGRYKSEKGDNFHYTAMKRELLNAGVDVDALQKEAEERYPMED